MTEARPSGGDIPQLSLDVVVTGGSAERVRWGDWGEAVMLAFR